MDMDETKLHFCDKAADWVYLFKGSEIFADARCDKHRPLERTDHGIYQGNRDQTEIPADEHKAMEVIGR